MEATHTQFHLTICLVSLTYLCHGHPSRGPALSPSIFRRVELGAVMNSKTTCDGKIKIIATLYDGGINGS